VRGVNVTNAGDRLAEIRRVLSDARAGWGVRGEVALNSGLSYFEGQSVVIRVRKRGHRYDLDDGGTAARLAGKPDGWLELSDGVVAREGFNINRRGVVAVSVVEGRDLASLVLRLADSSVAVYSALLEIGERQ
jgi:hypothetical protein